MFVAVLGVPTEAAAMVLGTVRALVDAAAGSHVLISAGAVAEFHSAVAEIGARSGVSFNESPESALVDLITRAGARTIVIVDDPDVVAGELHLKRGLALDLAIRTASLRLAVLERATANAACAVIEVEALVRLSCVERIAAIATAIGGLPQDIVQRATIASEDKPLGDTRLALPVEFAELPLARTLKAYALSSTRRHLHRIGWEPAALEHFGADRRGAAFDLTGRPRLIVHGLNCGVPAGRWTAALRMSSEHCYDASLTVRVVSKDVLAEGRLPLPVAGEFVAEIQFEVEQAEHPVEFHLLSNESAIEGRVACQAIDLVRVANVS